MGSAAAGKFVVREFDDFTDKTTVRHKNVLSCGATFDGSNTVNKYGFRLRQVKTKDFEAICLDCEIQAKDWFHARNGRAIFNCDQQNFSVDFAETSTKADHIGDTLYCFESGHYELSMHELQALCNARVVKLRIQGDSLYEEPGAKWMQKFQAYCIQFRDDVFPEERAAMPPSSASAPAPQAPAPVPTQSGSQPRIVTMAGVLIVGVALGIWVWSKFGPQSKPVPVAQTAVSPSAAPLSTLAPVPTVAPASPENPLANSGVQAENLPPERSERADATGNTGAVSDGGGGRAGLDGSEFRAPARVAAPQSAIRSIQRIEDGTYSGTLSCGPLLGKAEAKGWQSPVELTVAGSQVTWRRGNDNFEENAQSSLSATGTKIDALGYYYPSAPRPGRWRTRGTLTIENSTLKGAFEQVDPTGDRQNRVCQTLVPVTLAR